MAAAHQNIRRRSNGTIDIDFYRQSALTERQEVMTGFLRGQRRVRRGIVAAIVLAAAVSLAPSRDGTGWNEAAATNAWNSTVTAQSPAMAHRYAMRADE